MATVAELERRIDGLDVVVGNLAKEVAEYKLESAKQQAVIMERLRVISDGLSEMRSDVKATAQKITELERGPDRLKARWYDFTVKEIVSFGIGIIAAALAYYASK